MNDAGTRGDLDTQEAGMRGPSVVFPPSSRHDAEFEILRAESVKQINELQTVINQQASEIASLKYQLDMLQLNEALQAKPTEGHTWTSTGPYMPLQLGAEDKANSSSASLFMAGDQ